MSREELIGKLRDDEGSRSALIHSNATMMILEQEARQQKATSQMLGQVNSVIEEMLKSAPRGPGESAPKQSVAKAALAAGMEAIQGAQEAGAKLKARLLSSRQAKSPEGSFGERPGN